ncbi:MAG TPA: electron transfer flavoprotein subunit alpha [Bacteroidales bacterium]|nr:MAG: hypothetical protein A2X11_09110 [Bacteroidetes bacterium GWE2_42_24]OFY26868.1 MAG: hypothetical protein A2X09_11195 [Bacteroidetes bacterium GWF2_43_11]HAQ64756.1 electron transfer flavoprotein subunit alpha [Bacteroidales bacterium]HBZ67823.1 electron transfer flavoprotein subunit alpha [Bacteroidales bacterium]
MRIAVCMSHVPDTTTRIRIDDSGNKIDYTGVQWVINPWDELALTRALELKELPGSGITEVVVVNAGDTTAEPVIRKALAIGADRAIRIDLLPEDGMMTARALAEYFASEMFEVIMAGLESADYNGGTVGAMLGGLLNRRTVNGVSSINLQDGKWKVTREAGSVIQVIATEPPFVAIVQKGIAIVPRIPSMRGVMQARTKPLQVVKVNGQNAGSSTGSYTYPAKKGTCRMIDADNPDELIHLLKTEARVL